MLWLCPKDNPKSTGKPSARSGHTITCSNEKAFIFGGCGIDQGAAAVFNDMWMLHISDAFRWEKVDAMGDLPSPRWRHTATLLPDNNTIFVFGGLCRGKRFNDAHLYDMQRREWHAADIAGTPPHPRSHHTASLVEFDEEEDGDAEKKIFIIGGYGGHGSTRDFTMDVHALDLDNWSWSKIERIKGPAPKPRADHTVCVADNLLILSGGRGSAVTDKKTGGFSGYFDDVHILDLADQVRRSPQRERAQGEKGERRGRAQRESAEGERRERVDIPQRYSRDTAEIPQRYRSSAERTRGRVDRVRARRWRRL